MRILFLQDHGLNESLALTELSAWLRARGHETRLFLINHENNLWPKAREYAPRLVLIPSSILAPRWTLRTAETVHRELATPTVLAGTLPTLVPEIVSHPAIDYVCVGEAEGPVASLVEALANPPGGGSTPPTGGLSGNRLADLPGIGLKVIGGIRVTPPPAPVQDLDTIPMPDRGLYHAYPYIRDFGWKKFLASRGCLYTCSYCYLGGLRSASGEVRPTVRRKSPSRMIEEIRAVRDQAALKTLHFSDDLFGSHPDWLDEFADLYAARIGRPFTANTCAELISERAARALRRAGCRGIAMGVEVGNESVRRDMLEKRSSDALFVQAADRLHREGIRVMVLNMIGLPGETPEDRRRLIELNRKMKADCARVQFAVPLPRTAFGDQWGGARSLADSTPTEGERSLPLLQGPAIPDFTDAAPVPRFDGGGTDDLQRVLVALPTLAALHRWGPSVLRLLDHAPPWLVGLARFAAMYQEKAFSGIGWIDGLLYYLRVGRPERRTANFPSLV